MEDFEAKYYEIAKLYDYAEELVSTVESPLAGDAARQISVVEPLINEIGDATDTLTAEFLLIAESSKYKTQSKASRTHIESALRRIFTALGEYQRRVRSTARKSYGAIMNIADPIVQKIHRHLEQIVVIFLEFVQVSLQSIMNKVELESLKQRDTRIAMMMHQQAMAQQG